MNDRRHPSWAIPCTLLFLSAAPGFSPAWSQTLPADSPIAEALRTAEAGVAAIVAVPEGRRTFENTLGALDDVLAKLRLDTDFVIFMQYVSTDAKERERGERADQDARNWLIALSKREDLYRAVRAFADSQPQLSGEQKRALEFALRDYRRAGMELPAEQREKLKQIEMEVARLGIEFEKHIREDTTSVPLSRDELRGLPEKVLAQLKRDGEKYLVTMDYPTFNPLLDFCQVETSREAVWRAYKSRCADTNIPVLEQILKLRAQQARMLGYAHAADFETETRMARNAAAAKKFYDNLRPLVRRKAKLDWDEFTAAKRQHTGDAAATLKPWDFSFYKNRLLDSKYAVDTEKVREYFPLERVVDGLFSITQSLYGLEYRDATAKAASSGRPIWHPDVRLYEVWDKATGEMLGEFYIDLFPRDAKYNHAAQWGLAPRKVWKDGTVTRPLAALVCNFSKPTATEPSLLRHDEVETFFHEFGHCLHSILTNTRLAQFSGPNVATDFVEAPSQMFENWVWDAAVLKSFARHYQTGAPFPDDLLKGMLSARHLGSGLDAEHQFYYALVDLEYHSQPDGAVDTRRIQHDLFSQIEQYAAVEGVNYQATFGHLVGYQAGYYGYMWSLVYACDMFQRFREQGMLSPEAGRYYRGKILARGGSVDEFEMLRDYLGREPRMEPFLEHLGLKP
ncbi:MAG: Oligopeptidase A [Phycisphaerae bacterium]|nr:Oligopeptidase A [Phycisphaerae bacterium]